MKRERGTRRLAAGLVIGFLFVGCTSESEPREPKRQPNGAESAGLSVLYAIRSGDPEALAGVFRVSVPDGRPNAVAAEPFDGAFYGSRDGRLLLRRTPYELTAENLRSDLAVASSDDPSTFRTLVSVKGAYIEEILWSSDPTRIFYLQSVSSEDATQHELRSIGRDGTEGTLINRFQARTPVDLVAVDASRGKLYWTDEYWSDDAATDGHRTHIWEVDLSDGSAKKLNLNINPIPGPDLVFAPNGTAVYYLAGPRIVARNLSTGREKTIYRSKDPRTYVGDILMSPDGTTLYFKETDPDSLQNETIYALSIEDARSTVIYRYRPIDEIGPVRLSPDGSWMWIGDGTRRLMLNLRTGQTYPFVGDPEEARFEFLTWIMT